MSETRPEAEAEAVQREELYELFIGVLTLFSIAVVVFHLIARSEVVREILVAVDALVCTIFVLDFARSLVRAPRKQAYLWPHGVIDLLGSIPIAFGLGWLRVLRLIRVSRTARMYQRPPIHFLRAFVERRAESAVYVIVLSALVVLTLGSVAVSWFEVDAPTGNIKTGGDAFWWAFVTIATVGYGDEYPVTAGGRLVGIITMALGIGVFGVFTGYLSSLFLRGRGGAEAEEATDGTPEADFGAQGSPLASGASAVVEPPGTHAHASAQAPVLAELALLREQVTRLERLVVRGPGPGTTEGADPAALSTTEPPSPAGPGG